VCASTVVSNGAQQLTYPSRAGNKPTPPQCSSGKDSSPVQVAPRRRYALVDILRLGGELNISFHISRVHFAGIENHPRHSIETLQPVSLPRTASAPAILTPSNFNVPVALKSPLTRVSSTTSYSSTSTKVMTPQNASPQHFTNHPKNTVPSAPLAETKITTTLNTPIVMHPLLHPRTPLCYDFLLSVDHPQQKQNLLRSAQVARPFPFNAPAFPHNTSITKITLSIEKTSWLITITPTSNQFYITIQAILNGAQNFLSQPITDVTWNAASSQARSVAEKSCATRGGKVKRRIDWLGGKTKFGGLDPGFGSVGNAAKTSGSPLDRGHIWFLRLV